MKCKKTLAGLLSLTMALSLCACGNNGASSVQSDQSVPEAPAETAAAPAQETESSTPEAVEVSAEEPESPRAVIAYPLSGDDLTITMSFDIHGTEELNTLMAKIRQIDGVLDIERTTG